MRRHGVGKRALGTPAPIAPPQGPNQRGFPDVRSDPYGTSRNFRLLPADGLCCQERRALIAETVSLGRGGASARRLGEGP